MPLGIIVNCLAVLAGGLLGTALKRLLTDQLKEDLPVIFGLCAMSIGINSVIKVNAMTPVVLAVLAGTTLGIVVHLQERVQDFFGWLVRTCRLGGSGIDMDFYITAVAIFCFSGLGFYGALTEGITGDGSILMSKAVLDVFTAMIFACSVGLATSIIALPQFAVMMAVFAVGVAVGPALTPAMFADLSACGGILTLAAGMRIAKLKNIPVVDMMPALVLVMPLSALWTMLMG